MEKGSEYVQASKTWLELKFKQVDESRFSAPTLQDAMLITIERQADNYFSEFWESATYPLLQDSLSFILSQPYGFHDLLWVMPHLLRKYHRFSLNVGYKYHIKRSSEVRKICLMILPTFLSIWYRWWEKTFKLNIKCLF